MTLRTDRSLLVRLTSGEVMVFEPHWRAGSRVHLADEDGVPGLEGMAALDGKGMPVPAYVPFSAVVFLWELEA